MSMIKSVWSCLLPAVIFSPAAALACGEVMFNAGKGLPFQRYLAPQPADVVILRADDSQDAHYEGFARAGHHVTLVADSDELAMALGRQPYDIVIARFESLDTVMSHVARVADTPHVLPVVARSLRKSPQVRERFDQILVDGASVGQYLMVIDRVLSRGR